MTPQASLIFQAKVAPEPTSTGWGAVWCPLDATFGMRYQGAQKRNGIRNGG